MLIKQEFKIKDKTITLERFKGDGGDVSTILIGDVSPILISEESRELELSLETPTMRKLVKILSDSPFIFSENNNEK